MKTVGRAVIKAKEKDTEDTDWDPAWQRFAGLYRSAWSDVHVVMMNERLVLLGGNARGIDLEVYLEPIGNDRFTMQAPNGSGPVGKVVRFV
ncbi:MAG: hypothetical protein AAGI72_12430 [Pseudomonadota bacterium]